MRNKLNLFFTIFISVVLVKAQKINIFSPACESEMLQIESCISQNITKENINTICESSKSPQCQQFLNDPMSVLPSCSNFKGLIMTSTVIYNNSLSLICEKSEDGNICPFTEYEITSGITTAINNPNADNKDAENAIRNTCASAKCRIATQKYLQYLLENSSIVEQILAVNLNFGKSILNSEVTNKIKSLIDILNGEECNSVAINSAVAVNNTQSNQLKVNDNESSATTRCLVKPSIIILFAIYMVIYYLI